MTEEKTKEYRQALYLTGRMKRKCCALLFYGHYIIIMTWCGIIIYMYKNKYFLKIPINKMKFKSIGKSIDVTGQCLTSKNESLTSLK